MYQALERPDLERTPLPDLSLINPKHYSCMAIQYSRGCPFNCEFCDIIEIYGRKPRTRAPAQIIAELEQLYARRWRGSIFIVDDNFIGNKKACERTPARGPIGIIGMGVHLRSLPKRPLIWPMTPSCYK